MVNDDAALLLIHVLDKVKNKASKNSQRLIEGNISRLKFSRLKSLRLNLSWLKPHRLRLLAEAQMLIYHRWKLSESEAGSGVGGQSKIIFSFVSREKPSFKN